MFKICINNIIVVYQETQLSWTHSLHGSIVTNDRLFIKHVIVILKVKNSLFLNISKIQYEETTNSLEI